jgi:hypothetical protein
MEYRSGILRCSDCDIALVESLPEENLAEEAAEDVELVEMAHFTTVVEADMVKEMLEANDLHTIVRGEVDPIGATSGAAPITLLVEEKDLERATEIYNAFFAGEAVESEAPTEESE